MSGLDNYVVKRYKRHLLVEVAVSLRVSLTPRLMQKRLCMQYNDNACSVVHRLVFAKSSRDFNHFVPWVEYKQFN